jgi:cyclophilin family peptidyl-prolyl cis-trans isomerase
MKKLLLTLIITALMLSVFASCSAREPDAPPLPENDPGDANYAIISIRGFGEITVELKPEYAPLTVARFVENVRSGFYTGRNFHRVMADFMMQGGSYDRQGGGDPNAEGIFTEVHPDARHYYGAICLAANMLGYGSDSFFIINNKDPEAFVKTRDTILSVIASYQMELGHLDENEEEFIEMFGQEEVDAFREYMNEMLDEVMEKLEELDAFPAEVIARYAEVGGVPQWDGGYTVFGYTVSGFDVIDAIAAVPVELQSPLNPQSERSKPTQEIIIEWIVVKTTLD